jgi:D-amino-acid dehydrogenase
MMTAERLTTGPASPTGSGGQHVLVIGAGIVGTATALYLQRAGFTVTIADKGAPGEGCTFGNSGAFGVASCVPLSVPGIIKKVPSMLLDPMQPLTVRWSYLHRCLPWLVRYVANGAAERVERIADARVALLRHVFSAYEPLWQETGTGELVRRAGLLTVFESDEGFAASAYATDLRRRRGIREDELTGDEARELEPALAPSVKHALLSPDVGHTLNPQRLAQSFATHAQRNGGRLMRAEVHDFEFGADGPVAARTSEGRVPFDLCVLAAGAWSVKLAARLGTRVPLQPMRGYHAMMPDPGVKLTRLVVAAERRVGLTHMEHGLRASGTSEFAAIDAPRNDARADVLATHAQRLLPGLRLDGYTRWVGSRPTLPDSTPVIARAPRHRNVLFAFGHDQIGVATGAITGKLIAELATNQPTTVDLTPYRADRF